MWGDKTSFSLSYSTASRSMVNDAVSSFSTNPNLSLQVAVLVVRLCQAQATDLFLLVGCRVMVGLAQSFGTPACLSWLGRTSPTFDCLCGVASAHATDALRLLVDYFTSLRLRLFSCVRVTSGYSHQKAHCLRQWCTTRHGPCIVDYGGCLPQNGRDQFLKGLHHHHGFTKSWSCTRTFSAGPQLGVGCASFSGLIDTGSIVLQSCSGGLLMLVDRFLWFSVCVWVLVCFGAEFQLF